MEQILHIVKNLLIFILLFSIISNLFSKSRYHKYFDFIQGIIIIIIVMMPLFAWFTSDHVLDDSLMEIIREREEDTYENELKMIGEQRDQMLLGDLGEGGAQGADE